MKRLPFIGGAGALALCLGIWACSVSDSLGPAAPFADPASGEVSPACSEACAPRGPAWWRETCRGPSPPAAAGGRGREEEVDLLHLLGMVDPVLARVAGPGAGACALLEAPRSEGPCGRARLDFAVFLLNEASGNLCSCPDLLLEDGSALTREETGRRIAQMLRAATPVECLAAEELARRASAPPRSAPDLR